MAEKNEAIWDIESILRENPLGGEATIPKNGLPESHIKSYMVGRGYDVTISEKGPNFYMIWEQRGKD